MLAMPGVVLLSCRQHVRGAYMKLVTTTLSLILIAASHAFPLRQQDPKTTIDEPNYKRVHSFSGYLVVDDYPYDHVREWLKPIEIATVSEMPTMKRGKTMGAFVELMGCKPNAQGVCNAQVDYTIYKPDGSTFATRAIGPGGLLWKKYPPAARRNRKGLARMHFRFGKDDPAGEYKVKAKVSDLNADISFEIELNFSLK
jgi:hypothetical protein